FDGVLRAALSDVDELGVWIGARHDFGRDERVVDDAVATAEQFQRADGEQSGIARAGTGEIDDAFLNISGRIFGKRHAVKLSTKTFLPQRTERFTQKKIGKEEEWKGLNISKYPLAVLCEPLRPLR